PQKARARLQNQAGRRIGNLRPRSAFAGHILIIEKDRVRLLQGHGAAERNKNVPAPVNESETNAPTVGEFRSAATTVSLKTWETVEKEGKFKGMVNSKP